jgi:predicted phosphatase
MIDHATLRKDLMGLAHQSRHYIFADAKAFLLDAQKKQHKLFLISAGDPIFQKEKIQASDISSFFEKVVITTASQKSIAINEIKKQISGDEIVFIDDKKEAVEDIKKYHPHIKVMQMARVNRIVRSKLVDGCIKNFSELQMV